MLNEFVTLRASRKLMLKFVQDLNHEQLNIIPDGFNNNIIWNMAHLVVTQQLLWYSLSKTHMLISAEMVQKFKKGTKPKDIVSAEEIQVIKNLSVQIPEKSIADFKLGIFTSYTPYMTSFKVELRSIEDAIKFNNYHEGLHIGVIMAMRKLV